MRCIIAVLALGLAPACTTDEEAATVYDPCSPLTIAVEPDLGTAEAVGVEDAVLAWARVLPTRIEVGSGSARRDVLPIRFVSGNTFYRAIYWDSLGTISISRDRLAPEQYAVAIAHELGHAFGLLHVAPEERPSVMNVGNVEVAPTERDAAEVAARWETCTALP